METWNSFLAVGDSFTEGLDDWRPDGTPRGWADRVAEQIGAGRPGFRYANLAVRGKLLDQIVAEQVPVAERLRPDLVTFAAGGNDMLRFLCDTDDLARRFDAALGRLAATGAMVIIFTGLRRRADAPADPAAARPGRLLQRVHAGQCRAARQHRGRPVGHVRARRPARLGTRPAAPRARGAPPGRAARARGARRAGRGGLAHPFPGGAAGALATAPSRRTCGGCATTSCPTSTGGCGVAELGDGHLPKRPELLPIDPGPQLHGLSGPRAPPPHPRPPPRPAPASATNGTFAT